MSAVIGKTKGIRLTPRAANSFFCLRWHMPRNEHYALRKHLGRRRYPLSMYVGVPRPSRRMVCTPGKDDSELSQAK